MENEPSCETKRKKESREDWVEHLIHRKWTEPHKASFLSELAAVGGAAVEKALLIWIKQGLLFNIPLLWVSQVKQAQTFFFLFALFLYTARWIVQWKIYTGLLVRLQVFCSVAQLGHPRKRKIILLFPSSTHTGYPCDGASGWKLRLEIWLFFSYGELEVVPRLHFPLQTS